MALAFALVFALVFALAASTAVWAQSPQSNLPDAPQPSPDRDAPATAATAPQREPANTAPPNTTAGPPTSAPAPEQSSSSDQARGDISPPKEDELAHPSAPTTGAPGTPAHPGAGDVHEWNPLRAMKDVEVGTYYYKAGNYKAAISRFREALEFKPRDAVATFKLAQALEKDGELDDARTQYEAYLAILKDGPDAGEARKSLERLRKK